MPARAIRKSNKKRPIATDSLGSNAEKIVSGVDRQLIELIDSDENSGRLRQYWPDAPAPCVVVVPGIKGHFNYIRNIADRLQAEGFVMDLPYPHRPKTPGQLPLQQEAAMKRRQAKEDAALTADQKKRIERNRAAALEKLAQKGAGGQIV